MYDAFLEQKMFTAVHAARQVYSKKWALRIVHSEGSSCGMPNVLCQISTCILICIDWKMGDIYFLVSTRWAKVSFSYHEGWRHQTTSAVDSQTYHVKPYNICLVSWTEMALHEQKDGCHCTCYFIIIPATPSLYLLLRHCMRFVASFSRDWSILMPTKSKGNENSQFWASWWWCAALFIIFVFGIWITKVYFYSTGLTVTKLS